MPVIVTVFKKFPRSTHAQLKKKKKKTCMIHVVDVRALNEEGNKR